MLPQITISFEILDEKFTVCRLDSQNELPSWATSAGSFFSITKTSDELSIVCLAEAVPEGIKKEGPFGCFKIVGPLDFALTGILSSVAAPLAEAGISIFAISTFDTDYILVGESNVEKAKHILTKESHKILS